MPQIKISDATAKRYKEVRQRMREKLGTSKITQTLIRMNDDDMHEFANDLLELFDTIDPVFGG